MCLLPGLKLRRTGLGRHRIGVRAHTGTCPLCHNRPHQLRKSGRLPGCHQASIGGGHKPLYLLAPGRLNRTQEIGLHQGPAIGNGCCYHGVVKRRDLGGSLPDGCLEYFPCIGPRPHLEGALFIGHPCHRKGRIKQQAFCCFPEFSQVQVQPQAGKCTVAGICKCQGEILMAVGRAVVAFNPVIPILVHAPAVKLIVPVIVRMLPHIFQGGHDLKGGAGRVQPLGRAV